MESEIIKELVTIRVYVFIIMCVFVIWFFFKILESLKNIISGFKRAWDEYFSDRILKMIEIGKYEDVIEECKEKLEKYPNHIDAVWYLARAYYYTENNELSLECFERVIYLSPTWEESATPYIEKLNAR